MRVVTLGTGNPLPDPSRAGPATLVQVAGRDLLFDCGWGVLMRAAAAWSGPASFASVFLTHLHSDHVTDFNDVVTMRWVGSMEPSPLPVIGPPGTQGFVDRTLAMLSDDIGYRMDHHADLNWEPVCRVTELTDGIAYDDGEVRVIAAPTDHAPVHPTIGYRAEAEGKVVVIAGDTVPCVGLDRLCAGADVYVQTVIRRSLIEAIPVARLQDIVGYHSSIQDAAATATRAGVGTLVLTHLVPAPSPGSEHEWEAEARDGFDGTIIVASDLWQLDI